MLAIAAGGMSSVSVKVPEFGAESVTLVLTSPNESARHVLNAAGVSENTFAAPIVPVVPVTVMVMMPPMVGGFGPATTLVTLFAAACVESATLVNEKFCAASVPPIPGGPFRTVTVCVCAAAVSTVAVRKKNAVFVWPGANAPRACAPDSLPPSDTTPPVKADAVAYTAG